MSRYLPARVLLLLLALSIVPAAAHADSFLYTVTSTFSDPVFLVFPTQFSFTQPTIASSGFVTSGLTQISGSTVVGFSWNSAVKGTCSSVGGFSISFAGSGCGSISFSATKGGIAIPFPGGSFLTQGTYTANFGNFDATMTVNIAQTGVPEPSSLLLLGSGILGLLGAVRRKLA